jgi:hypothetical protein
MQLGRSLEKWVIDDGVAELDRESKKRSIEVAMNHMRLTKVGEVQSEAESYGG